MEKIKIIAESASNHNGNYDNLLSLAKNSKLAGADYFTVQICDAKSFCDDTYPSIDVVKNICFTQLEWKTFFQSCRDSDINLIPCPTEIVSLNLCIDENFELIKIHGTDILTIPMLEKISENNIKVILETQFATERDIDLALSILGKDRIECLIHGYSNYPTEGEELNLNAIQYMKNKWKLKIGFADHSLETDTIPMMAISKGATWLEKHITLSRNDRNYDWQVSLEPEEFSNMVMNIKKYNKALGKNFKHPTKNENYIRKFAFKKYLKKDKHLKIIRSENGCTYYEHKYKEFKKDNIIATVCGRLTSTRLKRKLFIDFHEDKLIFDVFSLISKSKYLKKQILATSNEVVDNELFEECDKRDINVFRGSGNNLIHRLLDIAEIEKAGAIIKITGDSPFAVPEVIDAMCELYLEQDLDYVRAINLPQGVSTELFSTNYLQKIYQKIENPLQSEYLGYFVILDNEANKGCVKVNFNDLNLTKYKLSIDLEEDLQIAKNLLEKIKKPKFGDINLKDILNNLNDLAKISDETQVKMPDNTSINYYEYISLMNNQNYKSIMDLKID